MPAARDGPGVRPPRRLAKVRRRPATGPAGRPLTVRSCRSATVRPRGGEPDGPRRPAFKLSLYTASDRTGSADGLRVSGPGRPGRRSH
eukprot:765009-Hanusia_phi.AAC.3